MSCAVRHAAHVGIVCRALLSGSRQTSIFVVHPFDGARQTVTASTPSAMGARASHVLAVCRVLSAGRTSKILFAVRFDHRAWQISVVPCAQFLPCVKTPDVRQTFLCRAPNISLTANFRRTSFSGSVLKLAGTSHLEDGHHELRRSGPAIKRHHLVPFPAA